MKALLHSISCCLILTACSGGNYDDNTNAPINKPNPSTPSDPNNPDDPNKPDRPNNGKRIKQNIDFLYYDVIEDNFGAGDSLYLDNIFKTDSGLPLTYEVKPLPYHESGVCKITGEDNNILQTIKQGFCYIGAKQAGNETYLPASRYKEITIPLKCADNERPVNQDSSGNTADFVCVPNYAYIHPIEDDITATVGLPFELNIQGYKLYSDGQNLKVSLPHCDNLRLDFNGKFENDRYVRCTPSQAGESRLIITNQDNGKELLNTTVIFKDPAPIPPMPITKSGITWCANDNENNIDCADKEKLGAYYGLLQDGVMQVGIAHDYETINQNGDSCVIDKATGRVWELKTDDGGLRDKDWLYNWYSTDASMNDGVIGERGSVEQKERCGNTLPDGLCNSQAYIKALNQANYCGFSDWRLPRFDELYSLVDLGKLDSPPMVDSRFDFVDAPVRTDAHRDDGIYMTQKRYGVSLYEGRLHSDLARYQQSDARILAVRHLPELPAAPEPRFEIINNGTEVRDNFTKLIWQRCAIGQTWDGSTCTGNPAKLSWLEGLQQASALGDSYRLPTLKELMSLSLPTSLQYQNSIDAALFPNALPDESIPKYMSSSPTTIYTDNKTGKPKGMMLSFHYGWGYTQDIFRMIEKGRITASAQAVRSIED